MGPRQNAPLSTEVERGQAMAIDALAWLGADEARLERFLALSGLGPQNLRLAASDPGFFTAILDYLGANEPLLLQFASETGRTPAAIIRAGLALSGGPAPPEF